MRATRAALIRMPEPERTCARGAARRRRARHSRPGLSRRLRARRILRRARHAAASAANRRGQAAARRWAGRDTGRHPRTAGHSQLGDGGPAADAGALSHVPRERRQRAAHHPCRHALPLAAKGRWYLPAAWSTVGSAGAWGWESRSAGASRLFVLRCVGCAALYLKFSPAFYKRRWGRGAKPLGAAAGRETPPLPPRKAQEGGLGATLAGGFPQAAIRMQRGCAPVYGGVCGSLGVGKPLSRRFAAFVLRCVRGAPH